jgi:hypothetical protein
MRPRPMIASRRLETLKVFRIRQWDGEAVTPYRSDGLVFLWLLRRGGQTGASGSSSHLALFLLASRWA